METRFQTTSFIPKASLDNVVDDGGHLQKQNNFGHTRGGSLFTIIAFFIFVCSLVAAGVVFSLNRLSVSNRAKAEKDLTLYQAKNTAETIEEIKSLNNRLDILAYLLENHVSVRPLFGEISNNTLDKVSFNSFSLKQKPDGTFALTMRAQGIGYESIVVQDNQFSKPTAQKVFKNTSISDFSKPKGQDVATFTLNTTVVESAVRFASLIRPVDAPTVAPLTPTPPQPNTPNTTQPQ